jgi:hypothetical protein
VFSWRKETIGALQMSQGLSVYAAPNAVSVIESMGRAIAKSQFIKCDNVEQGMVLAMTCYSKGLDFLTLVQKYDLIFGRLAMKSDAMLSGLRERGGKHKIVKRTPEEACVVLTYDGQDYESRITWEDARKEPFVYNGKESVIIRFIECDNQVELAKILKPKYATPRSRTQMLWARAVSDGVRALCPEVNTGVYTPEETEDFTEESSARPPVRAELDAIALVPPAVAASIIDAEFVVEPDAVVQMASGPQITRMTELFRLCGIDPAGQMKAFASVGARDMASVTVEGAQTIIAKMEARLAAVEPAPPAIAEPVASADDGSAATTEQVATIKKLIESVSQREGMAGVPGRIKDHLNRHGVSKITHLTELSAQSLINSLDGTTGLDDFFDATPRLAGVGK